MFTCHSVPGERVHVISDFYIGASEYVTNWNNFPSGNNGNNFPICIDHASSEYLLSVQESCLSETFKLSEY